MVQLTPNEPILDLRTEEPFANMHFKINGDTYIRLSTTDNITMYKDTYKWCFNNWKHKYKWRVNNWEHNHKWR